MKCWKSRKPTTIEVPTVVPSLPEATDLVFVVIGHNRKHQGATNYNKESEYTFNKRIGLKLLSKLSDRNIKAFSITRPTGSYSHQVTSVKKQIKAIMDSYGRDNALSVNLHFNSAGKNARGCECLIVADTSRRLADGITDNLNETLGIKERRDDGVFDVSDGHNGSAMLHALEDINVDATIVEPCFADYRTKESMAIFEHEDRYVDILAKSIDEELERRFDDAPVSNVPVI